MTTISTTRSGNTYNSDRNNKRERNEGGGGGGGAKPVPAYNKKYEAKDGGD